MRSVFPLSAAIVILSFTTFQSVAEAARSVNYNLSKFGRFRLHVITVNLSSPDVVLTPVVAKRGVGRSESFASMMRRARPAAAIDGTFFCTRTLRPTGDIVIDHRQISRGYLGTAIGFDYSNNATFIPTRLHGVYDPSRFQHVLVAGPTLILRGKTIVMPAAEGFRSRVHFTKRIRAAIGLTYHKKLLLVATTRPVGLRQLAIAMKKLGCVDAASLDGGSSTGIYYKGKQIVKPGRSMTNCLLVYDNPLSYFNRRENLQPSNWARIPSSMPARGNL